MTNRFFLFLCGLAVFLGGNVAGFWFANGGLDARADSVGVLNKLPVNELKELSEVYAIIRRDYVEALDGQDLMNRASRGMVASLDPHSAYLSTNEYQDFVGGLTNEEYGGVGIYIGSRDDWIEIIAPIYDSPAQRANLQASDLIIKIEDESTQGMSVEDAVSKMRGVVGTVLELDVLPAGGGEVRHVELVRETIVTPSVLSSLIDDGYGYLRITRFQNKTLEDLVKGINGLYAQNEGALKGIVLDLRDNPGGYLLTGVGSAAVFLSPGATVVLEKGRDEKRKVFTAESNYYRDIAPEVSLQDVPLVVLVNNGSASASEIVAGALQDHRRGVIIGTRTYGKASVQTIVPLRAQQGKSALRLTTARYYTPLDRNIQARGIEPDIVVNQAKITEEEEGFALREADMSGHLENTNAPADGEETEADSAAGKRPPFIDENDYQYEQAVQILKALAVTASGN